MFRHEPPTSLRSMPVLEHIKRVFQAEFGHDFSKLPNRDNTLFVINQHGFASIVPMMDALVELGISPDQVFMTTKPHTTPPEDMLPYFKTHFEHYVPFQWSAPHSVLDQSAVPETEKKTRYKILTEVTHDKLFDHFCDYLLRYQEGSNRKIENIIICDEGGKFLSKFIDHYHRPDSRARRNLKDYHVVAIEHTKCGTYRPELMHLPFPLINMADSYLKTTVESRYIAESMFVHLDLILQRIMSTSAITIGVVGGGNIGKEVLTFLSRQYSTTRIIVFDLDSSTLPASDIAKLGWQNIERVESAECIFQQSTVILGCTGKDFMKTESRDCFAHNQTRYIHLISCSSGDSEFQTWLQRMPDYKFESLNDIRDYTIPLDISGEKRLTLYNGGFPMNFYIEQPGIPAQETVPLNKVQITRSMKFAAIVQALKLLEVTPYISQKDDASLKDYMKLDVLYQWEIIQSFYNELREENTHKKEDIEEKSMGVNQPDMNSVLKIPHYVTTNYQIRMQDQLSSQKSPIKILVIHGTAGSGKTTLAHHYFQKQQIQFPMHLSRVILAETKEQWWSSLNKWVEELVPDFNTLLKQKKDIKEQRKCIVEHLQHRLSRDNWCVLIDNWDQNNLHIGIIEHVFFVGHGTLLMTTQGHAAYPDPNQSLDLSSGLSSEESQQLMKSVMHLEKTMGITWQALGSVESLMSLTEFLNRLPLGLVIAGSYLLWENKSRRRPDQEYFTYSDYQQLLEQKVAELIRVHDAQLGDKGYVPREYEREEFMRIKTQEAAVDLSLKKAIQPELKNPNTNLWQLLCFCGFLASDGIPRQLLKEHVSKILQDEEQEVWEVIFDSLLEEAQKYSLLQFESKPSVVDGLQGLHMHRVVQKVLRDNFWPKLLETTELGDASPSINQGTPRRHKFIHLMRNSFQPHFSAAIQNRNFSVIREYSPHVKTYIDNLKNILVTEKIPTNNIFLQSNLADSKHLLGNYSQAEALYREILTVKAQYNTGASLMDVDSQIGLSNVLEMLGRDTEAYEFRQRALTIATQFLGPTHAEVAKIQNSLASSLSKLGKNAESLTLHQQALETTVQFYGTKTHIEVASQQVNLAINLEGYGRYEEAIALYEEALTIKIRYYGTRVHIDVAQIQGNLAGLLQILGRYDEAKTLLLEALDTTIKHYGTKINIDVAGIQQNLAALFTDLEEYAEAEALHREALDTMIHHYGGKHNTEIAKTQQNIAIVLHKSERYDEAEMLYREALDTKIRHYGTRANIDVAPTLDNLAHTLKKMKRYIEAEALYREAMEITIQHCGTKFTIDVSNKQYNLALLLKMQQRYSEAEVLYREALDTTIKHYGIILNAEVANTQISLAHLLVECRRYTEAEVFYQAALDVTIQLYGRDSNKVDQIQSYIENCHELKRFMPEQLQPHFSRSGEIDNLSNQAISPLNVIEPIEDWSLACSTLFGHGYRFLIKKTNNSLKITRTDNHLENPVERNLLERVRMSFMFFLYEKTASKERIIVTDSTNNAFTLAGNQEAQNLAYSVLSGISGENENVTVGCRMS